MRCFIGTEISLREKKEKEMGKRGRKGPEGRVGNRKARGKERERGIGRNRK